MREMNKEEIEDLFKRIKEGATECSYLEFLENELFRELQRYECLQCNEPLMNSKQMNYLRKAAVEKYEEAKDNKE